MNLLLSDEHRMIQDHASKLFRRYDPARRSSRAAPEFGHRHWNELAEGGWLDLAANASSDLVSLCLFMFEAGRAGSLAPLIDGAVLPGRLLSAAGKTQEVLGVAAGEQLVTAALERGAKDSAIRAVPMGNCWRLDGRCFGQQAGFASRFVVAAESDDLSAFFFVIEADAAGVQVDRFAGMDGGTGAEITIRDLRVSPEARLDLGPGAAETTLLVAAVCACAEATGMMAALLLASKLYAETRKQFGRPIIAFQAIEHRLARMLVAVEEARALTLLSAIRLGEAAAERKLAVSVAKAKIGALSRSVAQSAVQIHGGMGVSEEMPIAAFFRRLMTFEARFGSTQESRENVEAFVRDADDLGRSLLDVSMTKAVQPEASLSLHLDQAEIAFQAQVRTFFANELPESLKRGQRLNAGFFSEPDIGVAWNQILHRKGWIAPGWPVEYGGTGWSLTQRHIFELEWNRAGAPYLQAQGLRMVGPVIMRYGTEAQKAVYLPRILSGEDYWCQGYSEPESGSDLASLKTKAERKGDHYIVNGSKMWTSHAHHANRMFALVRTAESEKRQYGITFLLIDMDSPGIEVRPILTMDGAHEVNQVFFTDVHVPVTNRVGEENHGWECAKYLLEFERGGALASGQLRMSLARAHRLARSTPRGNSAAIQDHTISERLGEILCDLDALEMLELSVMSQNSADKNPGPISSVLKLRSSEIRQAISEVAVDIVGLESLRWTPQQPLHRNSFNSVEAEERAAATPIYLSERAHTIFAGSTEIQLSIIARTQFN